MTRQEFMDRLAAAIVAVRTLVPTSRGGLVAEHLQALLDASQEESQRPERVKPMGAVLGRVGPRRGLDRGGWTHER